MKDYASENISFIEDKVSRIILGFTCATNYKKSPIGGELIQLISKDFEGK